MTSVDELLRVIDDTRVDDCCDDIIGVANVIDALNAKLTVAVGAFEASGKYGVDGALSMRAWLGTHTSLRRAAVGLLRWDANCDHFRSRKQRGWTAH